MIEIKTVPAIVFYFHLPHFQEYFRMLKNYFKDKNSDSYEDFSTLNREDYTIESEIAHILGFDDLFEKDKQDTINYIVYKALKEEIGKSFLCNLILNLHHLILNLHQFLHVLGSIH